MMILMMVGAEQPQGTVTQPDQTTAGLRAGTHCALGSALWPGAGWINNVAFFPSFPLLSRPPGCSRDGWLFVCLWPRPSLPTAEAASPLQAGFASVALSRGACVTGRRAHSLLLESKGYCQEPQKDVPGQVGSESEMVAWPGRSPSPAQLRTLGLHRSGSAGRPGVGLVSDAVSPPCKAAACSDSVPASWRGLEYAPFYGVD